jgi:hypothetical protein
MEDIMRMLLKAVMDTEAANQDSQTGTIVENTTRLIDALKPEAAYFVVEDGQRSCLVIFDMEDPSRIPSICEPIFLGAKREGHAHTVYDPRGPDQGLCTVPGFAGGVMRPVELRLEIPG